MYQTVPRMDELKTVWPNFKVDDERFNWVPGDISIKTINITERGKQIPKSKLTKGTCKYGGECTNAEKNMLAVIAALDIREGRERIINKTKSYKITISNFAVLTCCEKMARYLKSLKKEANKGKISWTKDTVICESYDMMRGRKFD